MLLPQNAYIYEEIREFRVFLRKSEAVLNIAWVAYGRTRATRVFLEEKRVCWQEMLYFLVKHKILEGSGRQGGAVRRRA